MRVSLVGVIVLLMLLAHDNEACSQPCPPEPGNISVVEVACLNIIEWTYATNPNDFEVLRGLGASIATATRVAIIPGSSRDYSPPFDGDASWYTYFVRARITPTAECPTGLGAAAAVGVDPLIEPTPTGFEVTSTCASSMFYWDANPSALGYRFVLGNPGDPAAVDEMVFGTSYVWHNPGGPAPVLAELYSYSDCGFNPNPASLQLSIPDAPAAVIAVSASENLTCRVDVAWTPNPLHTGGHRVYRNELLLATLEPGINSYSDMSAMQDVTYTYQVTAFTTCGNAPEEREDTGIAPSSVARTSGLPQRVPPGLTASLAVPDAPAGSGVTYTWRRGVSANGAGGVAVVDDGRVSGSSTPTLVIAAIRASDGDFYALDAHSSALPCGVETTVVPLVVPKSCAADFDDSGALGVPDIFAFLSAWFAGCP